MNEKKEQFIQPDGGYGWVIVASIILINASLLTLVQNFGIIYQDEFQTMGITAAQKSFLLHLHSAILCVMGLFTSPLLKKYSFRSIALIGASLMCFGIFCSSFAKSYETLILCISVCIGFGQGILMPATYLATNTYFKDKLTIAVSISVTGAGLAPTFMPVVCVYLLKTVGRSYTVLVLFGIALISIPCCLLLKPIKHEMVEKMLPKVERKTDSVYNETTIKKEEESITKKLKGLFDVELLRQRDFMLIVVILSMSFAAELNVVHMIQFILPELAHFKDSDVATASISQSVADIAGRLFIPLLAHMLKVAPKVSYSLALILATCARTGIVVMRDSYFSVMLFCFCFGLSKGARAVFQSVIVPKFVAFEKLPVAIGINMLLMGIATLIIGPTLGLVHDLTHSYVYSLHVTSILCVICVLMWTIEWLFWTRNQKQEENIDENVQIS